MPKHGLRALGLAVMAVLGLMVFSVSAALGAELNVIMEPSTSVSGVFLIGGVEKPTGLIQETIDAAGPGGRLIIPAKSSEIDCTADGLIGSPIIENVYEDWTTSTMRKGGHGSSSAVFTGCSVFATNVQGEKGAELKSCTQALNGGTKSVTANGLLRLVRHEGASYVVLEPNIASKTNAEANILLTSAFTTMTFGGACALPEIVAIGGGIVVKAPTVDTNRPKLSVKSWEVSGATAVISAEQKLLGARLTFGVNPAFIEAKNIEAELTGFNSAASWGAM